jgi:hypothetical protein
MHRIYNSGAAVRALGFGLLCAAIGGVSFAATAFAAEVASSRRAVLNFYPEIASRAHRSEVPVAKEIHLER